MKRISILLIMLVIMSIPISVDAQTTEFQVTNSSIVHNADGFDIALTVNWYHVAVVLKINGEFYSKDWTDGPNNTYLFFWFKYDHLGVDAGEIGELTIELSNVTRVYVENDYALEHPERVLTFAFSVPFPEPENHNVYEPPHDYDASPDIKLLEPNPFDFVVDFISYFQWSILMFVFAIFLVILGIALGPAPEKQKKTKTVLAWKQYDVVEVTDAVKSLCDWDGEDEQYIADRLAELENKYAKPQTEPKQLPVFSDEDDDSDWRVCPYCGEWNHGETTRCVNCDGRLGRPLAR